MRTASFLVLFLVVIATAAGGEIKPVNSWEGKFSDDKDLPKQKLATAKGYLTDDKDFAELWKAWRGEEKLPEIDFKKHLVFVATVRCAANRLRGTYTLDDKGNLTALHIATRIGGPGFAWRIDVVP